MTSASSLNPPPVSSALTHTNLRQRTFAVVVQVSVVVMVVLFVMLLINGDMGDPIIQMSLATVAAMGLALSAAYGLYRAGQFGWAANVAVFSVMAAAGVEAWWYGSLRSSGTLAVVAALAGGGMFLERRALVAAVAAALALFGLLAWAEVHGWLATPTYTMSLNVWLTYAATVLVVAYGVHTMRSMLQEALDRANSELVRREAVESALRRSQARFYKAFASSPMTMTISRVSDGTFIEVNSADLSVLSVQPEKLVGRRAVDTGGWPSEAHRERFVAELRKTGRVAGYETQLRNRHGELVECRVWATLIDVDGEECILCSIINATAQKLRETQLLEVARGVSGETGEAFFRSLVEHLGRAIDADMVMVGELGAVDSDNVTSLALLSDGKIVDNITYALTGTPCAVATRWAASCTYNDRVAEEFPDDHFLAEGKFRAYLGISLRDGDGTPIGILNAVWRRPLQASQDRDALMQIFASRCEAELVRLRRDREIARLGETLEERVRDRTAQLQTLNAELESFAYSVSHDLKTPLTTINGFTSLLTRRLEGRLGADEQRMFERILLGTSRMEQLTSDILALSRVSRSEIVPAEVNLSVLAANTLDALRQRQPERAVQVTVPAGIMARCDPRFARIVMDNLIGNAWKYSAQAPVARIEFGVEAQSSNHGQPPQEVLFVRDNGVGFDMKHIDKLFKPFHRLHGVNEFEGNGIGLATVRRIMERHGGAVWCEATEGEGATFYFRFDGPRPALAPVSD